MHPDEVAALEIGRGVIAFARAVFPQCRALGAPSSIPEPPVVANMFTQISKELRDMSDTFSTELAALKAIVTANTSTTASAVALLNGINDRVAAAVAAAQAKGATDDQVAELKSLTAEMGSDTQSLGAAITANTPAATDASTQQPSDGTQQLSTDPNAAPAAPDAPSAPAAPDAPQA